MKKVKLNKLNYLKAFTLAEILIVLGIVGVVAELTIPSLISNMQKQQYVTSLKKFYTNFNQVLNQVAADKGCIGDLRCTGLFKLYDSETLGNEIVKYYKVTKNCKTSINLGCWTSKTNMYYDGSGTSTCTTGGSSCFDGSDSSGRYKFITADGMSVYIWGSDCNNTTNGLSNYCGYVHVDINGLKGPNRAGRDTFSFYMLNKNGPSLYPIGGSQDTTYSWKNGTDSSCAEVPHPTQDQRNGMSCTGRILEKGWQMDY